MITTEDIRRSGATNLPDLLRMVPGLEVAQINPSTWAISARGFNGQYSNKLLVLIDGRTVYTPTFSGVFWDAQDVPLDLIERIEVIRGPGATVWGANAVNGVINITYQERAGYAERHDYSRGRHARAHRRNDPLWRTARHRGAYRVFTDGFEMGHFLTPEHLSGEDDWYRFHGGFRADANLSTRDSVTIEGEAIRGNAGERSASLVSLYPP